MEALKEKPETINEMLTRVMAMPRHERREIIRAAKKQGKEGAAFIEVYKQFKMAKNIANLTIN